MSFSVAHRVVLTFSKAHPENRPHRIKAKLTETLGSAAKPNGTRPANKVFDKSGLLQP